MPPPIRLPRPDGPMERYVMRAPPLAWTAPEGPIQSRVAFAAAHVVADPLADRDPLSEATLDGEATLAYRRYLWSLGLAVAEAMDTAQRGGAGGLGWPAARELIRRSLAEARATGGGGAGGAGRRPPTGGGRAGLPGPGHGPQGDGGGAAGGD